MARQLTLLEIPSSWRLDDTTRDVGRRGIAAARASLQAAVAAAGPAESIEAAREHASRGRSAA